MRTMRWILRLLLMHWLLRMHGLLWLLLHRWHLRHSSRLLLLRRLLWLWSRRLLWHHLWQIDLLLLLRVHLWRSLSLKHHRWLLLLHLMLHWRHLLWRLCLLGRLLRYNTMRRRVGWHISGVTLPGGRNHLTSVRVGIVDGIHDVQSRGPAAIGSGRGEGGIGNWKSGWETPGSENANRREREGGFGGAIRTAGGQVRPLGTGRGDSGDPMWPT